MIDSKSSLERDQLGHTHSVLDKKEYNAVADVVVSCDTKGIIEYWSGYEERCSFPASSVNFEFKSDTDLYELLKTHSYAISIAFSHSGTKFAIYTSDKHVIIFWFKSGKKCRVFDESTATFIEDQQNNRHIPDFEFGRRLAVEKELEKTNTILYTNLTFDESDNFLIVPSMIGIKCA
uniref:Peptidylprolyl isomerase domain and WD repeat-containing protein 1 (Trinotate prediction) n=1 Tax=Henneguya salminicola TaxID=69463 RepID=A0A6G3MGS1_HENSL